MSTFYVTEAAGEIVAGGKNPGVGQPLTLTEAQAEHPLRLGHIRRERPSQPEPRRKPRGRS